MGTYSSMQARVQRQVIDLPAAVTAEVPNLVNLALRKLQERHSFKVMESEIAAFTQTQTHNVLLSVGGAALSIPASLGNQSFKEWRGEPWFLNFTDGSPRFMSWAPSREAIWGSFTQGGNNSNDQGFPQLLLEEMPDDNNNRIVSVYPIADGFSDYSDGEYRITIPYYRYLAPLVNTGDSNWLTTELSGEEFIVAYACARAFKLNWDFDKFQVFVQEAEVHYNDLVRAEKRQRLGPVKEWATHWRGDKQNRTRM